MIDAHGRDWKRESRCKAANQVKKFYWESENKRARRTSKNSVKGLDEKESLKNT
jgi:hypothetical protein